MKSKLALLCGAVSIVSLAGATQSFAQPAPVQVAANDSATTVGEVVVTARRREESLQDVPTSVAVFDQKTLTQKSVASAFDLSKVVPGLSVGADSGNAGITNFSIRGKGQNYGSAAGSVETYFADVPLSAPFQMPTLPPQFFDLQNLQVLKGPQGVAFGRSTTGGAVLLVPHAPTDEFGGYARVQGGTYGDFQFEGAVNIPLAADKIDLRLAAFDWQRDGYMHAQANDPFTGAPIRDVVTGLPLGAQTYDNVNTTEFRGTLRVRPVEGLENTTILTYHYDKTRSSSGSGLMLTATGASAPEPGFGTRTAYTDVNLTKPANKVWAAVNTTTYDLNSSLTLKNIFGYIHATGFTNDGSDSDGTTVPTISLPAVATRPRHNKQLTDELQLQGHNLDNRLTWVVGGLLDNTREPTGANDINIASVVIGEGAGTTFTSRFQSNTIDSRAVYGTATYKITDALSASAGYRHSWDDIKAVQASVPCAGAAASGIPTSVPDACRQNLAQKSKGNTYDADLSYKFSSQAMVYGGYRRGYKHGGFNSSQTDPALAFFGPETIDDFFLGLKTSFNAGGMPGRFNIEGYYDKYHGMQNSYLSSNGQTLTTITDNVPGTRFQGFDADLALEPTHWLTLTAAYTLIDAKNTDWPDTTLPCAQQQVLQLAFSGGAPLGACFTNDLSVNPVAYASKNKWSATARFHTHLANDMGEVALAPTVSYQSKYYFNSLAVQLPLAEEATFGSFAGPHSLAQALQFGNFNTLAHGGSVVPAYTIFDLRAEWNHILGSRVDGAVNVTNLTNKLYFLGNSGTLNFGFQGNAYAPPRMYTVELSTTF